MPSSISDTTCSTPENDTVERIIKNDTVRYVRKGYGLFFAIVIFLSFFYFGPILLKAAWPFYLSLGEPKYIIFFAQFLFPSFMYALANLIMWFIYVSEIPFFERYRIWPEKQWPWQKDPVAWRVKLRKTLKNLFINQFIVAPAMAAFELFVTGSKCQYSLESFPDHITIIKQITFMMVVEDFFFYWGHRALHTPYFYQLIHKTHHEYYNAISICAEYAHPIEFAVANVLTTSAGYLILGSSVHMSTFILWLGIRVFETIDGHCGYEFSWSPYRLLPLSGSSEYHNYHHSHNIGVYGSFFTYLDTIFKTNKDYFAYKARKERKERALIESREFSKAKIDPNELNEKLSSLSQLQEQKNQ
ncbi:hypothetical protein ABPG74_012775 [Tetrahymena malaccensis]